jgi:hypothetical protein
MEILTSPASAIARAKKEKNLGRSIGILVGSAVLLAIAAAIGVGAQPIANLPGVGTGSAIGAFVVVLVGGLFLGWIVKVAMTTLGGRGEYFEGVTAVAYTSLPISVGIVIAAIISAVATGSAAIAGAIINFVVLAFFGVLGLAIMYRSVRELFRTDMITALIGVAVIYAGITIAGIYVSTVLGLRALTLLPTVGTLG